jgi:hypothetical protein
MSGYPPAVRRGGVIIGSIYCRSLILEWEAPAAEGEVLQVSDYLSGIGTIASGLGMLGLAEALRLLLRITA